MFETLLVLGSLTALSFIILIKKIENRKWDSLIADGLVTIGLLFMFSATLTGLGIAIVAGLLLSVYFYIKEPKFINDFKGLVKWKEK